MPPARKGWRSGPHPATEIHRRIEALRRASSTPGEVDSLKGTQPAWQASSTPGPDEVIELDRADEIEVILQRLEWISGRHVVLVVPGRSDLLASPVHLRLLARRAEALRLDVLLVAKDGTTRVLAREAGVKAYSTRFVAMLALRRLQKRRRLARRVVVGTTLAPAGEAEHGTAVEKPRQRRRRLPGDRFRLRTLRPRWKFISGFVTLLTLVALVAILGFTLFVLLPEATVTVVPAVETVSQEVTVIADANATGVDFATRTIPARMVTVRVEGSGEIPTASRADAPDEPARGTLWFANRTAQEVDVPMGTTVRTSTGSSIRFTTTQTVTVPAGFGNRVEAPIVATVPGPSGNVGPYLITTVEGTLSLQVTAVNDGPTSGGSVRQAGVVTHSDRARLKEEMLKRLRQEAMLRLQDQLDPQEFIPAESLQVYVISEYYDRLVDELADILGMKMQIGATAVAVAGQEANRIALDALQRAVPPEYDLIPRELSFERGQILEVDQDRRVHFVMEATGYAKARLETRGLREALAGQPVAMAEAIVMERLPVRRAPMIELRPSWGESMPELPFRIHVVVVTELE